MYAYIGAARVAYNTQLLYLNVYQRINWGLMRNAQYNIERLVLGGYDISQSATLPFLNYYINACYQNPNRKLVSRQERLSKTYVTHFFHIMTSYLKSFDLYLRLNKMS